MLKTSDAEMLGIVAKLSMDDQITLVATLLRDNNGIASSWLQRWLDKHARYAHVILDRAGLG